MLRGRPKKIRNIEMDIESFTNEGRSPDGNIIIFHMRKIKNNFLSKQQDELYYDDIPYMKIISPGQRYSTVDRKVHAKDKAEHKEQWEAFEKKQELRTNGTPLSEWSGVETDMIRELEHMNVFTVEDLANVNDANLTNIGPGARKLQDAAKLYVAGEGEIDNIIKTLMKKIEDLSKDATDKANPDILQGENPNEPTNDSPGNTQRDWLGRSTN